MLNRTRSVAERGIADKAFPGGQVLVVSEITEASMSFGRLRYESDSPLVTEDVLYDLASVSKIVATTSAVFLLIQRSVVRLDTPIGDIVEGIADPLIAHAPLRSLLSHSAGFAPWKPFFRSIDPADAGTPQAKQMLFSLLKNSISIYTHGTDAVYSDLDMMMLGYAVEKLCGCPLDEYFNKEIAAPLAMDDVVYRPLRSLPQRTAAPTENCPWRKRTLCGEVDDENTHAAGGVLGQAGLFATAIALKNYCKEILESLKGRGKIFERELMEKFTTRVKPESEHSFCLGFDGRSPAGSRLPSDFGPRSFGHWGFTGTGIWFEPDRQAAVLLLTNRVHPSRENNRINVWRPLILSAALKEAR